MAIISKAFLASVLVFALLVFLVHADEMMNDEMYAKVPRKIDCRSACSVRCSLSSRPNLCKRACGTCCARCSCVPPGTSGNHRVCPCYAALKTHGGRPKCP